MTAEHTLLVVNHARDFPWSIPGAVVVSARDYLTGAAHSDVRRTKVINLCRYDRYQSRGYYVSLLAEARGQEPLPQMKSVGDLQGGHCGALEREPFTTDLQRWLIGHVERHCSLDVVFGHDPLGRHDKLALAIFAEIPAPLLRVRFDRASSRWVASDVRVLGLADLGEAERAFMPQATRSYLTRSRSPLRAASASAAPSLAILHNADEPDPPSNKAALDNFRRVGAELGARVEIIDRHELATLREFDALFIRDCTRVNHYTYEFARHAADEGLVVVDDPDSILHCTNKVFLHELLGRHHVPMPKSLMVHRNNVDAIVPQLGLPCVLRQPDSALSVFKAADEAQLALGIESLFARSDLVLAQEWLPTAFDWRVGIFDRRAIFVCQAFQGTTRTLTVGEAPDAVVRTAMRAANLIGDGLYGADIKEVEGRCYVTDVNDNPNIDAGNEDAVLKDALYRDILGVFLRRIRERKGLAAA